MALTCISGCGECTGCMMCQEEARCACCGAPLGDDIYSGNGRWVIPDDEELYCSRCILELTEDDE